jgi:hypothetical protein
MNQTRKERIKNKPINEADEFNDEETKQSPIMQFGTNDPIMIESNSGAKFPHAMSISQYSGATSAAFRSEAEWFSVSEWFSPGTNTCLKLRRSHQYVTFKTKIIEQFENVEDAYTLLWVELFKKYPAD